MEVEGYLRVTPGDAELVLLCERHLNLEMMTLIGHVSLDIRRGGHGGMS
jgi:hypothetical protein